MYMRHEHAKWPKPVPVLTPEEVAVRQQISIDVLGLVSKGFLGWVVNQGHSAVDELGRRDGCGAGPVCEIGCGTGAHMRFHGGVERGPVGVDVSRPHLLEARKQGWLGPLVQASVYELPFRTASIGRVLSIYLFEHLHDLPPALAEIRRILKPGGDLLVALPTEGGLAWEVGRRLFTKRWVEKRYNVDYLSLIRAEHCNSSSEVIDEIRTRFRIEEIRYLPFWLPTPHVNAVVVLRCSKPQ